MSEIRVAEQTILIKMPRKKGKMEPICFAPKKIQIYAARQFKFEFNRGKGNFFPIPPIDREKRKEWNLLYFRLQIDGKWFCPNGVKYHFFTLNEIIEFLK